ncbi:hypothetical protein K7432_007459 [Basidiobolus ranarum]|uniref:Cyclin N-terminal domain-containing protein n=1 Tax=Basidiobolus ranarum TaxID=34480 RepID=A0ABR2W019_9FUNG
MIHSCDRIFSSKFVTSFVVKLWYGTVDSDFSMLESFCDRVLSWCDNSPSTIYLAFKYLQRLKQLCPHLGGSKGSEIRAFSTALLLAHKYIEDRPFNSRIWSAVTGLNSREICIMEREFLTCIQYQTHVTEEEFYHWKRLVDVGNQHYQWTKWQTASRGFLPFIEILKTAHAPAPLPDH